MAGLTGIYNKLYRSFFSDAAEWIVDLENCLLRLEKSPMDKELINKIFRIAHNLKSTSGTVGLNDIHRFAHAVEDILYLVRQGELTADKRLIDALLEAVDMIEEMIEAVKSEKHFDLSRCEDWIKKAGGYKSGGL